ncbi:MFS transporter [Collinsella sp. An2]|uniref:MFS transporter n=1 Tax=Collinsella sp. An2 TaxID=1965585 RepID=UPI000B38BD4E|nr:MFS transporter [Collinsella sp. An2]OUP08422.1 MFS transporter [Collinsella sp. An2]
MQQDIKTSSAAHGEASQPARAAQELGQAVGRTGASSAPNKWIVLFTVVLMTFMSTLDSSIVNVALPAMQRELAVGASDIQWVSSVYLLVCCVTVLVFGRLGDLFGKVKLFQGGVALFTIGSALCGLSTSLPMLIAARVVQGLGAASATANNMGIVTEVFPTSQRGRALGIVSTFVSLGMMCGPTIGGVLVSVFPWESIFLINVPVGIVALLVGLKTLPRDLPRGESSGFDVPGALLLAPSIFLIFFSLTNLAGGVTAPLMVALVAGIALFVGFVVVERRVASPLVRLDVFRNAEFSLNLAAMFLCFVAVGGTELILPFYLQDACGLPSNIAGLALTAIPLAMAVAGPFGGALSDRIGSFWPCLVGLAIYAAGIALVGGLTELSPIVQIVGLMAFMAVGTGLFQSPNNSLIMGSVDLAHLGFAGSLVSLVRYMGMSAGVTGGTELLYGRMSALAGMPVSGYIEGRPDLFLAGFSFTFMVFAALTVLGAVFLIAGAAAKKRSR